MQRVSPVLFFDADLFISAGHTSLENKNILLESGSYAYGFAFDEKRQIPCENRELPFLIL